MNRLQKCCEKKSSLLAIFITAGYPELDSLPDLVEAIAEAGADIVEIGFPFSDSLVDGPTIQLCNQQALRNGMTIESFFMQVKEARKKVDVPMVFMGSINSVLRQGVDSFLTRAHSAGFDAAIIPDLPPEEYQHLYRQDFEKCDIGYIPLITVDTEAERLEYLDELAGGFLYLVSATGTTGGGLSRKESDLQRLASIKARSLKNKVLLGFGIRNSSDVQLASEITDGAIVGSALLREITSAEPAPFTVKNFVRSLSVAGNEEVL